MAIDQEYLSVSNGRRRTIRPGDKLPLARIELSFIGAHRQLVDSLEPRPPNRFCADADVPPDDLGENGHSLGYLLSLGGFQFLNLGDMTPDREHALACPENRIGVVDVWQVPNHVRCSRRRGQGYLLRATVATPQAFYRRTATGLCSRIEPRESTQRACQ